MCAPTQSSCRFPAALAQQRHLCQEVAIGGTAYRHPNLIEVAALTAPSEQAAVAKVGAWHAGEVSAERCVECSLPAGFAEEQARCTRERARGTVTGKKVTVEPLREGHAHAGRRIRAHAPPWDIRAYAPLRRRLVVAVTRVSENKGRDRGRPGSRGRGDAQAQKADTDRGVRAIQRHFAFAALVSLRWRIQASSPLTLWTEAMSCTGWEASCSAVRTGSST